MTRLALMVALVSGITATARAEPMPPKTGDVLASVQHYYGTAKRLTAKFRQTVANTTFGKKTPSGGTLYVVPPANVRFDYVEQQGPRKGQIDKSFISNGKTLWMVDRGGKQYAKQDIGSSPLPVAVGFLTGRATLATDFTVSIASTSPYQADGAVVLSLVPKKPSASYKQVYFVVAADGHVLRSVVVAPNDDVNDIQLFAPDQTTAIAPGTFELDPKKTPLYKPLP